MRRLVLSACLSLPCYVEAGELTYGCSGKLADGRQLHFTPERLEVVSGELASGNLASASPPVRETFAATEENYAIEAGEPYTFTARGRRVSLVPRSRKQLGERTGDVASSRSECAARHRGPRQFTRTLWTVAFELSLPTKPPANVQLECFEYVVSTCS